MGRHAGRIKLIAALLTFVSCIAILRALPVEAIRDGLEFWISSLGPSGPLMFGGLYVIATVLLLPASAFTLVAGAVFGLWLGFVIVSLASTTGAALAFLIARYLARSKVEQFTQADPRFAAIDDAIAEGGWRIVALLRLSPAVPFNVQNYLYGVTKIRFWPCVLTSWVAMIPGTFLYVYLGHLTGAAAAGGGDWPAGRWALLIIGLLATIAVTVYITRLARRQLKARTGIAEQKPASNSAHANTAATTRSVIIWTVVAAVFVSLAVVAQFKSAALRDFVDEIAAAFRPPNVVMRESYAPKPDGPIVDHSLFDEVLQAHVDDDGWVDYAKLQQNPQRLDAYLTQLESAPFDDLGRNQKLAVLLNAYNAFTLKLITEHYPVASIRAIPEPNRWEDRRWKVGSHTWSLSQIEHEQIRPHFVEPRIHFALVCAAVGCPPLARQAFRGEKLDEQLQQQAEYVLNHKTWAQFLPDRNELRLTPLFKWYGGDFEQVAGSVVDFVRRYIEVPAADPTISIRWQSYDWKLNSIENRQPR